MSIRGHVKTEVFPRAAGNSVEAVQTRKSPKLKRSTLQGQSKQDLLSCPSILICSYSEVAVLRVNCTLVTFNIPRSVCRKPSPRFQSLGPTTLRLYPNIALFLTGRLISIHQVPFLLIVVTTTLSSQLQIH